MFGQVEGRRFIHEEGDIQQNGILFQVSSPAPVKLISLITLCALIGIESCRPSMEYVSWIAVDINNRKSLTDICAIRRGRD